MSPAIIKEVVALTKMSCGLYHVSTSFMPRLRYQDVEAHARCDRHRVIALRETRNDRANIGPVRADASTNSAPSLCCDEVKPQDLIVYSFLFSVLQLSTGQLDAGRAHLDGFKAPVQAYNQRNVMLLQQTFFIRMLTAVNQMLDPAAACTKLQYCDAVIRTSLNGSG